MKKATFFILFASIILACKDVAVPEVLPETPAPAPALAPLKKIAAWGDSFTQGGGVTMPEFVYPLQLQKISGYEVYNGGIGGQTSTQIKTRMLAATDKKEHYAIIWVGANNMWQPQIIKQDIAEMVAFLGHKRFLVLSILNDQNEKKGTSAYNAIIKINGELKDLYKENYLEVRTYLVSLSNGSVQDEQDKAADIIPRSMRSDESHLNDKSYPLLAKFIYNNFSQIHSK